MGYYDSADVAGRAYDMKFIELHGIVAGERAGAGGCEAELRT
jgi:hypothetical protein